MKQYNDLIADFWRDYAALVLLVAGLVGVIALVGLGVWAKRSRKPLRPIALAVSMNLALLLNAEGMWVIAVEQLNLPKIFAVLVFAVFEICFLTATSLAAEQYRRTTVHGPDGQIVTPGHPGPMLYIAALIAVISGVIVASNAVTGTEKLLRLAVPCVIFLMWWAALTAAGQRVRRGRFAYSPRRLAERWGWLIPDDDPDLERMAAERQVRRMVVNHYRVSGGRWPRAWWRSRLLKDARTAGEPVVADVVEQLARIQRVMDLLVPGGVEAAGGSSGPDRPSGSDRSVPGSSVSVASVSGPSVSGPSVSGPSVSGPSVSGPSVSVPSVSGASNSDVARSGLVVASLGREAQAERVLAADGPVGQSAVPASPVTAPVNAPVGAAVGVVAGVAAPVVQPVQFVQPRVSVEEPADDSAGRALEGTDAEAGRGAAVVGRDAVSVPVPRRSVEDAGLAGVTASAGFPASSGVAAVPGSGTVPTASGTFGTVATASGVDAGVSTGAASLGVAGSAGSVGSADSAGAVGDSVEGSEVAAGVGGASNGTGAGAPAVPAWAAIGTGARPAVSIVGSPWWRLAVERLSRLVAAEISAEDLPDMTYPRVAELVRALAPRVSELGEGVVRAFVLDYVRELSGEHAETAYPWRDLLPEPATAPAGSPAWLAALEDLRNALEEEISQGELPTDARELAELLAPSAPRLDDVTIRGFVSDYLLALGGQTGPGSTQPWQHLLPRPQSGRGPTDEAVLEVYGAQLEEHLRATGRLSRYKVQAVTGVKSRLQADRIKAAVEERAGVTAPA